MGKTKAAMIASGIIMLVISIIVGYIFFAYILPWIVENVSEAWHKGKVETIRPAYELNNGSLVIPTQSAVP